MAREKIAMPHEEVEQFLAQQRWAVLATLDEDGSPWADLVACALVNRDLHFQVCRTTRSHANIERDPRVCCAMDVFPSYYEIKGASVHGHARRVEDSELCVTLASRLADPGVPVADPAGDDSDLYVVSLDDVFSFDFGRIQSKY
ncbi:pyridoxamine 5'-phosphate oxidase family protein [Myxococcota bacterium]|nr:pyridoxamine 5'-phosphate oxidase family protein [Myxococcota bacterium]